MREAAILILVTTGPFLLVGLSCITFLLLKRVELRDEEDDDDYGDRLYRYHDSPDTYDCEDVERGRSGEKTPLVPAVRALASEQRNHMVDLLRSRWTTERQHTYAQLEQEDGGIVEFDAEMSWETRSQLCTFDTGMEEYLLSDYINIVTYPLV